MDKERQVTFPRATCEVCPLSERCVRSKKTGRAVRADPYEAYLQKARTRQQIAAFNVAYRFRPAVERKIGKLVRCGLDG
ncbi:MAG: transposase [Anaerolineae bacterium]|nr:transposase [Anaerolineae bacterium]